jgi:hypothetical protein
MDVTETGLRYVDWLYEIWLWSSRNAFTASTPVHLQLTERDHLPSTPFEKLWT